MNAAINSLSALSLVLKPSCYRWALLLGLGWPQVCPAQGPVNLKLTPAGSQFELRWPARWVSPAGIGAFPFYEVQQSEDLRRWQPIGQKLHGHSAGELTALVPAASPSAFYRVVGNLPGAARTGLAGGGDQVFGYAPRFAEELARIGQISPAEFARRYGVTNTYVPGLSWDPTTAKYWDLLSTNAAFQLNATELAMFKTNGFVVSPRLGSSSFADLYYRIFKGDLPVFVPTDAILQAWHRSYGNMLEELEETWLSLATDDMLAAMAAQIPKTWDQYGQGVLRDSILDTDYFLTVALSLLGGAQTGSYLRQDTRVAATLASIQAGQLAEVDLFGTNRMVDFSQFTVRGHYTASVQLGRYFQAMMWLGRIDFRVAGTFDDNGAGPQKARPRELGSAIVLNHLLNQAGQFDAWAQMDRILRVFVGWTDSMTFAQLSDLLAASNIQSLNDIPDTATLERLQAELEQGELGFQNIRSDWFVSPLGPEQMMLPRSFTVMGQKFILDSWAMSQLVYDSILWATNGATNKVMRRIPSALDVAFSVLGNDPIVPELVARMTNANGRAFRDGPSLPYQHHLAAVREVVDGQNPAAWESGIYPAWLAALRELSLPTTDPQYPEAMRTRAWAMKDLSTQLASWTELRHDTILYAKPSYTGYQICMYPTGFVEPRVAFWERLRAMAQTAADLIRQSTYPGTAQISLRGSWPSTRSYPVALASIQSNQVAFLEQFAHTMATLKDISAKELAQQPLTPAESDFLVNLIQSGGTVGSGQQRRYDGWYPQLFYRSSPYRFELAGYDAQTASVLFHEDAGSAMWDALVADVHTDPPDPDVGDPGSVLHEGVGNVDLLLIAVDNGPDRMVYAGPVLSHYEFELIGPPKRMTDEEWKYGARPASPEWTRSYRAP